MVTTSVTVCGGAETVIVAGGLVNVAVTVLVRISVKTEGAGDGERLETGSAGLGGAGGERSRDVTKEEGSTTATAVDSPVEVTTSVTQTVSIDDVFPVELNGTAAQMPTTVEAISK